MIKKTQNLQRVIFLFILLIKYILNLRIFNISLRKLNLFMKTPFPHTFPYRNLYKSIESLNFSKTYDQKNKNLQPVIFLFILLIKYILNLRILNISLTKIELIHENSISAYISLSNLRKWNLLIKNFISA